MVQDIISTPKTEEEFTAKLKKYSVEIHRGES
jgi:hypothetical protein